MRVKEIKQNIEFQVDALFQAGYDLGWNQLIAELDEMSNREWNIGNRVTAEVIRKVIKQLEEGANDIQA
jgi:ribulose bisphosphate carboxylase small subunit